MKEFKDFGIQPTMKAFVGNKISIKSVLNLKIVVYDFKIEPSKYNGKCLTMQIELHGERRVVFVNASALMEVLQKIPKEDFPFSTTIIERNARLEFS
ncbi:hypothetical protein [Arachidicoccus soli]|uniref:Uncharacterized protein n=1 Tax=Arachidicoccus soli TaxID=2341117 RepID=A0A386HS12_9BACT|nr:hypothetical protein [Arachidicoccus soli]AYD48221.1 hypothetical protein D6B99_11795 [Arachidicoccus soli]